MPTIRLLLTALLVAAAIPAKAIDPLEPLKRILVPKPAFMAACRSAYGNAKRTIAGRGVPVPLTALQRERLEHAYGAERVARVQIRYNTQTPPIKFLGITLAGAAPAMTFDNTIFLRNEARPDSRAQLILLAHEFAHVVQYEKKNFSDSYCSGLYDADFDYDRNIFEKAAFQHEKVFAEFLQTIDPITKSTAAPAGK